MCHDCLCSAWMLQTMESLARKEFQVHVACWVKWFLQLAEHVAVRKLMHGYCAVHFLFCST